MARMIPTVEEKSSYNGSLGEEVLFEALKKLPDEFVVFHSVKWNRKDRCNNVRWGEADFVIFHPQRGLLVVEVKSGGISCDDSGIIYQINTLTNQRKRIYPMEQANRSKHAFRELLENKLSYNDVYWIEEAVWFTSVSKSNMNGSLPPAFTVGNTFFEEDIKNPLSAVERAFDFYNMKVIKSRTPQAALTVVNVLSPCFDAIPSMSTMFNIQEGYFNRMTLEQSYLLDYLEEQKIAAIQGAAGTGKTMLAIEKARRLSTNEKVLFLCFNKFLLQFLRKTFSYSMPNVDFYNLQTMASKALDKEATIDDVTDFLNDFDKYFNGWDFKSIIIDEGQDINESHIRLLKDIASIKEGSFYIFYDKHQLVQQRNGLDWLQEVECRLVLTMNCRNTRSIAETAGIPLSITNIKMKEEVIGVKPKFYITASEEESLAQLEKLIDGYVKEAFSYNQIVILTTKTLETSILRNVTKIGRYKLKFEETGKGILFTTCKKFKGLESDVVIVIDVSDETFESSEARRIYYVGASRAKHFLDFVTTINSQQERKISVSLLSEGPKNPRMAIMKALKVSVKEYKANK